MGFLDSIANPMAGAGGGGGGGDIDLGFLKDISKKLFGTKPKTPPLEELTPEQIQQRTIDANKAAASGAADLSNLTADQIDALIARQFPNLPGVSGNIAKALEAWTGGKISPLLAAEIRRLTAANATAGGYGGSGMHDAALARNYGLTGEAMIDKGINTTMQWLQAAERLYSPALNVFTGMMWSPEQLFNFVRGEKNLQFQRNKLIADIEAMPEPEVRGWHDMIMGLANSFLGGQYSGGFNPQQSYANAGAGLGGSMAGTAGRPGWGGEWNTGPYYVAPGGSTYYPDNLDFGAPDTGGGMPAGGGLPGGTLLGGF